LPARQPPPPSSSVPSALLTWCVCFCLAPAPSTTAVDRCCYYSRCFLRGVFASLLLLLDPAAFLLAAGVAAVSAAGGRFAALLSMSCVRLGAVRCLLHARSASTTMRARCLVWCCQEDRRPGQGQGPGCQARRQGCCWKAPPGVGFPHCQKTYPCDRQWSGIACGVRHACAGATPLECACCAPT